MNSCGMVKCSTSSHTMASNAASTMKPAFRMLLQAMMRARWLSALRDRINAYSGTMNRPPNTPISAQSSATSQPPLARNCFQETTAAPAACASGCSKYRSSRHTVMPIDPSGTRPISTLWPESLSQASEPSAVPMENAASSSVYTVLSPPSTSFA